MPVEVVLEEAEPKPSGYWFVLITGVPYSKGLVITNAHPRPKAERIKAKVEKALREFGGPPSPEPPAKRRHLTRLERI